MNNDVENYIDKKIEEEGTLFSDSVDEDNDIEFDELDEYEEDKNLKKVLIAAVASAVAFLVAALGIVGISRFNKNNKKRDKLLSEVTTSMELTTKKQTKKSNEPTTKSNESTTKNRSASSNTVYIDGQKNNTAVYDLPPLTNSNNKSNNTSSSSEKNTEAYTTSNSKSSKSSNVSSETDKEITTRIEESTTNIDYQIVDESGNIIESGTFNEEGSINGYVYDAERNEYVKEEDVGKYVYSEYDFYTSNGVLVIGKGELISVESYKMALEQLYYEGNKRNADEEIVSQVEIIEYLDGVVNSDGTYTISTGYTFKSKEDYEYYLINSDDYGMDIDGIIKPISDINSNNYQKTLN